MHRGQISFAFAGLVFGFLVGFVVAHQLYEGRGGPAGFNHPPIPAGMSAGSVPGASAPPAAGGAQGGGDMATMEAVQKQIASLKEQVEKNPNDAEALTHLGDFYFDAGMYDQATEYYEKALALKPGDVNVQTDLGTALRNIGQPREAMRLFEESVKAQPDHWKGWFNIGIVSLYDLHDFERAKDAFERVAALKPGTVDMSKLEEEIARVKAEHDAGGGSS